VFDLKNLKKYNHDIAEDVVRKDILWEKEKEKEKEGNPSFVTIFLDSIMSPFVYGCFIGMCIICIFVIPIWFF